MAGKGFSQAPHVPETVGRGAAARCCWISPLTLRSLSRPAGCWSRRAAWTSGSASGREARGFRVAHPGRSGAGRASLAGAGGTRARSAAPGSGGRALGQPAGVAERMWRNYPERGAPRGPPPGCDDRSRARWPLGHGRGARLRLAQALRRCLLTRNPHERGGRVHFFCAAPNALVFYLGQLASSLGSVVLYEFAFRVQGDSLGATSRSIELPPPGEATGVPDGF